MRSGALRLSLLSAAIPNGQAQSRVVGWRTQKFDSQTQSEVFTRFATGGDHIIAQRGDGSCIGWGYNGAGQCQVPSPPAGLFYVELAAGEQHTIARLSD